MRTKITHKFLFLISLALTLTSCSGFLEEASQDKDYIRSWTDLDELLKGDCYLRAENHGEFTSHNNMGMFLHLLADEIEEHNAGGTEASCKSDQHQYMFGVMSWASRMGASQDNTQFFSENREWTQVYKRINIANNVIEAAKTVPQTNDEESNGTHKVLAEAYFLRAYFYFWLTNIFANPYNPATAADELGVPLKISTEIQDIMFTRNTLKECYDQILADLLAAEEHMEQVKNFSRKNIYTANLESIQMLLSRVYLYVQDWQKAKEYSQKVIASHPAIENLRTTKNAFMVKSNPENIFSMGGCDLMRMIATDYQSVRVALNFYNSYHKDDLRKQQWFWNYTMFTGLTMAPAPKKEYEPTDSYYYQGNYSLPCTSERNETSSLFWLRSGEAYLNLAEAEAYLGNEEASKATLLKLMQNRYAEDAADLKLEETGDEYIARLREERKYELACQGHRWFDLRRYRVCQVSPSKVALLHVWTVYRDNSTGNILETRLYKLNEEDTGWTVNIPHEVLEFNVGMPGNGNLDREYQVIPYQP